MFNYTIEEINQLEATISTARFMTYLHATAGDREAAARLYAWNTAVSAAFYGPLQALEIGLRNAMHRELALVYGENWYDNPRTGLDAMALRKVDEARHDLRNRQQAPAISDIIAKLSFGFWVALLERGGRLPQPHKGKANYDKTLWRAALHRTFANGAPWQRKIVHGQLDSLRFLRNRIAHHEPIFARRLKNDFDSISQVLGWISPHKQAWMQAHCRIDDLLALPPGDPAVRF